MIFSLVHFPVSVPLTYTYRVLLHALPSSKYDWVPRPSEVHAHALHDLSRKPKKQCEIEGWDGKSNEGTECLVGSGASSVVQVGLSGALLYLRTAIIAWKESFV